MINIVFLIRSLDYGGAQRQLIDLVKGLDKSRFNVTIITFYDQGGLWQDVAECDGVEIVSMCKSGRWDVIPFLWRLVRAVYRTKPHIIHGYMDMANQLSLLIGKLFHAQVVWGIRASNVDFSSQNWISFGTLRTGAWLSRLVDMIIVNSYAGKDYYMSRGYDGSRMSVIPNGIDTRRYYQDPVARQQLRDQWQIAPHEQLIGLIARFDPMKDHATFLRSAALLLRQHRHIRLVCVGDGSRKYLGELQAIERELGLEPHTIWTGFRSDMRAVYNALDIAVSSSRYGEGFANVIGEAMACGIPCVVTAVGDSARIIGCYGHVVPPGNPEMLMRALTSFLDLPAEKRDTLASLVRQRIMNEYSVQRLVECTETALLELV
jgi:glycosyltransferase involved in cell wall biosynthesis